MVWLGVHAHDSVAQQFRHSIAAGRMATTFLFVGAVGIGKATFAKKLAQCLLCSERADHLLDACGGCPSCVQVASESHPDLHIVRLPEDKTFIPMELLVGRKEHRMREGLCHEIALKPSPGSRKIAIIEDADYLNREGANCLLKTLEEPPVRSVIILIGSSEQRQLPTIRSRAQVVRFRPLPDQLLAVLLEQQGWVSDSQRAVEISYLAEGSLWKARELCDPDMWSFRSELTTMLSQPNWDSLALARTVSEFVDAAGKEATVRRVRLRQVILWCGDFFRRVLRSATGLTSGGESDLEQAVAQAMSWWPLDDGQTTDLIEICLDALSAVDANANQSTLVAWWVDELTLRLLDPGVGSRTATPTGYRVEL